MEWLSTIEKVDGSNDYEITAIFKDRLGEMTELKLRVDPYVDRPFLDDVLYDLDKPRSHRGMEISRAGNDLVFNFGASGFNARIFVPWEVLQHPLNQARNNKID